MSLSEAVFLTQALDVQQVRAERPKRVECVGRPSAVDPLTPHRHDQAVLNFIRPKGGNH